MCFQVYFKPSHRYIERELESSAKTKAFTPLHQITHPSPSLRASLQLWYNLHSYFVRQRRIKRAYILLKYPFLAIHAKGGESMSPKQKDRTTTLILKLMIFNWYISNWYFIVFYRGRKQYFQNRYIKTLLNTKRRIYSRGSFV